MKLIIEIPEEVYNGIKILEKAEGIKKDTQITIPMEALANGKVIDAVVDVTDDGKQIKMVSNGEIIKIVKKENDIYSPR